MRNLPFKIALFACLFLPLTGCGPDDDGNDRNPNPAPMDGADEHNDDDQPGPGADENLVGRRIIDIQVVDIAQEDSVTADAPFDVVVRYEDTGFLGNDDF